MAIPKDNPEKGRQSNGASWARNGQDKRLATLLDQQKPPAKSKPNGRTRVLAPEQETFLGLAVTYDGQTHAPEVWARVEGFLAGWYVCHPELRPQPEILPQDMQSNEEVLEQIALKKAAVASEVIDDFLEAVKFAVAHLDNADAQLLPDGHRLAGHLHMADGKEIYVWHPVIGGHRRELVAVCLKAEEPYRFVATRKDIAAYQRRAHETFKSKQIKPLPAGQRYFWEPYPQAPPEAVAITEEQAEKPRFPVVLGNHTISNGEVSVMHSALDKALHVTCYLGGRAGKQQTPYPIHVKRQGDQVELDSRSATKTLIPLAEWQAFADTLQVSVSTVSVNTVERTPALEKMARDVVAFRREAPTDEAWGAERPSAAPTAPIPFPPPAAPSEEPLPPAAQQETTLRLRDGVRLHELRFVEWRPASLVYVNALGQQVEVKRERILMQLLTGDLILSGYKPAWAMRPAERKPEATTVEKPGHRARRWGYDYGLVVKGHLRKWHWITGKCICAECRAPIGEQGTEQVEGEPGAWYRECQGPEKHAIKTERDMTWKHPYLGANPGADGKTYDTAGVQEAYPWLQAVPDEEEIPF